MFNNESGLHTYLHGSIDVYIDTMLLDFFDQRSKGYDFA